MLPHDEAKFDIQQWRERAVVGISLLLAVVLTLTGFVKLIGLPMMIERFAGWLYPRWFVHLTGALELAAAGLIAFPKTRQIGSWLVMAVMFGAIITHLKYDYTWTSVVPAILFFAGAWYVNWELKQQVNQAGADETSKRSMPNGVDV